VPPTAEGREQRSGYPDLEILHRASGRLVYLDPKLYAADSETSSFRTFYYEPKESTGKINADACHLLVGIAHRGEPGHWRWVSWTLVDLSSCRVRLKAEFQGSNRDLYRPQSVIARSGAAPSP
jgi:hypothetical protein